LGQHSHRIAPGEPLPFGICDADGRLLLAVGQVIGSDDQLKSLLDRGAFVDETGTGDAAQEVARARPEELPGLWVRGTDRMARALRGKPDAGFRNALAEASRPVLALIQRDPDLAVLQVVRAEDPPLTQYACRHALHSAIAGTLAAERLGWDQSTAASLFNAALTMNLSVVDLQDKLATQVTPVTALQRQALLEHPERTAELLQDAGVTDTDWLAAVRSHHAQADGSGYPKHITEVGELGLMLQRVDRYTAMLSARATRPALPPDVAARQFYLEDPGSPVTAAIIKEFGIYPPGCTVRLRSGETGMVFRRGGNANTPIVAVVTDRAGDALLTPLRRD
jgi:HD-GYP domain-containing protein (c-di-GMP phosphodiesterase class II)